MSGHDERGFTTTTASGWKRATPRTPADLPEKARQAAEEVWAMAREFVSLEARRQSSYLNEVRLQTSGRQRSMTTLHTPTDSPDYAPLMTLLEALNADQRIVTKHGTYSRDDLHESGARVIRENGREIVQFPIRWPWRIKPDPDNGVVGVRGEPIYRSVDERGPVFRSFTAEHYEDRPPVKEWWES